MNTPADTNPQQKARPTHRPKFDNKTKKVFKLALIAVVSAVLIVCGLWFWQFNNAKKQSVQTLNTFVDDLKQKKIDDAYSLTTFHFREHTPKAEFALNFGTDDAVKAINDSYKQLSVEVPYNLKVSPVVIESEVIVNGDKIKLKTVFVKESGRWAIDSIVPTSA